MLERRFQPHGGYRKAPPMARFHEGGRAIILMTGVADDGPALGVVFS